jgi:SAM-dependent methyltransferase
MRRGLLEDIRCPLSSDPLLLEADASADEVESGELVCTGCGSRWRITRGIPRLVPSDLADTQRRTATAFGWQWRHFDEMHPEFEAQFLDWIHPLEPDFFRGRRVLDAGCGTGRHARLAASYGASEVVALDLSDAVDVARRTLAPFENAHVVQADLLRPPLRTAAAGGGFDLVYSIGVLHHLPDPFAGLRSLVRLVRPGGTIAVWVYGHENNAFVRNVVEPMRRVTTRIPLPLLRFLAWPLAVGFHASAKLVYRPLATSAVGHRLPLAEYLASVGDFSFRQNYGIVFDQLAAPTAVYVKGPELETWFEALGVSETSISHRHGNSWRAQGRVRTPAAHVDA